MPGEMLLTGMAAPAVYAAVAALVGIESVGVPVPGETGVIAAALLAAQPGGSVSLVGVFVAAWVGAVVGDSVGYAIGRRYGGALFARLSARFPHQFSTAHLAYATHLFQRHGAVTVFTGRFVTLLRIVAGPLAGSMNLPYGRFVLANTLGAAVWAGLITLVVGTLGASAHTWVAGTGWVLLLLVGGTGLMLTRHLHQAFTQNAEKFLRERESVSAL